MAVEGELADVTIGADDLHEIVTLKCLSNLLMRQIHSTYKTIVGVNGCLMLLGVIQPTDSAFLHNISTLFISLHSMQDLLRE